MIREHDDLLRRRALDELGPLGDPLARDALERGDVFLEREILSWEGSAGTMHAHRVVVITLRELCEGANASHATLAALTRALSAALAERASQSLAELLIEAGDAHHGGHPYREPA